MAPVENVDTMMNAMIGFMWGSSGDAHPDPAKQGRTSAWPG
jgi:hypothetical protein